MKLELGRCELQNTKAAADAQQEQHARQLQELVQAVEEERAQAQKKFESTLEVRRCRYETIQSYVHRPAKTNLKLRKHH